MKILLVSFKPFGLRKFIGNRSEYVGEILRKKYKTDYLVLPVSSLLINILKKKIEKSNPDYIILKREK